MHRSRLRRRRVVLSFETIGVIGVPRSWPRLAEIADTAADRRGGQPDRRAAGKIQIDRSAAALRIGADRQKIEDATLLAALKPAIRHAVDLAERDGAQCALKTSRFASLGLGGFPAKAVGNQH